MWKKGDNSEVLRELGKTLAVYRRRLNLSRYELAKRLEVRVETIRRIEEGASVHSDALVAYIGYVIFPIKPWAMVNSAMYHARPVDDEWRHRDVWTSRFNFEDDD